MILVILDCLDHLVVQDQLGSLAHLELQVQKEIQVQLAPLDLRDHQATRVHKVQGEFPE